MRRWGDSQDNERAVTNAVVKPRGTQDQRLVDVAEVNDGEPAQMLLVRPFFFFTLLSSVVWSTGSLCRDKDRRMRFCNQFRGPDRSSGTNVKLGMTGRKSSG